ncbi:hypothetical protein [Lactobacillus crispatus]|uniref:hypothetical protein n=1 Tax=Lactobacillus crispatus TaxID=47770 RepID=UPI0030F95354
MMITIKERQRIRFFKIINFCHQMIDLLNGATVQGIILDEESCRLTILNNLNHVPFSKYRRWRIKKYLDKSNSYLDSETRLKAASWCFNKIIKRMHKYDEKNILAYLSKVAESEATNEKVSEALLFAQITNSKSFKDFDNLLH